MNLKLISGQSETLYGFRLFFVSLISFEFVCPYGRLGDIILEL